MDETQRRSNSSLASLVPAPALSGSLAAAPVAHASTSVPRAPFRRLKVRGAVTEIGELRPGCAEDKLSDSRHRWSTIEKVTKELTKQFKDEWPALSRPSACCSHGHESDSQSRWDDMPNVFGDENFEAFCAARRLRDTRPCFAFRPHDSQQSCSQLKPAFKLSLMVLIKKRWPNH